MAPSPLWKAPEPRIGRFIFFARCVVFTLLSRSLLCSRNSDPGSHRRLSPSPPQPSLAFLSRERFSPFFDLPPWHGAYPRHGLYALSAVDYLRSKPKRFRNLLVLGTRVYISYVQRSTSKYYIPGTWYCSSVLVVVVVVSSSSSSSSSNSSGSSSSGSSTSSSSSGGSGSSSSSSATTMNGHCCRHNLLIHL